MGIDGGGFRAVGRRAVFLDRDGVLNANVFYPDSGCWEAPRSADEFALVPQAAPALRRLRNAGFLLFVISNQPNVAKGKSSVADFDAMHARLVCELAACGAPLDGAYYCTHHPEFTGACCCRKPEPYLVERAARLHGVALAESWMIGDRDTDMECGRRAGVRTAWICTGQEPRAPDPAWCDVVSGGIADAVGALLRLSQPAAAGR